MRRRRETAILVLALLAIAGPPARAAAVTAIQSGDWSVAATWSPAQVPTAIDSVTVNAGVVVTLDIMTAVSSSALINGTLMASRVAGSSWTLVGGDLNVDPGGTLDYGSEADPIPAAVNAHLVLSSGSAAGQYGLIVKNGGNFTVRGSTKTPAALKRRSGRREARESRGELRIKPTRESYTRGEGGFPGRGALEFPILFVTGYVTETLYFPDGAVDYRISPHSFFQTNTKGTEALYGLLRSWTRELPGTSTVLDLYCGGGGIALSLAGAARKVVGVELNPSAVADAKANAERNGFKNCEFYCAAVELLLPSLLDMRPEAVVVDPPRAGLHVKAAATLLEMAPPVIFYVSCNPESLGRDLKVLSEKYAVERLVAFDLFPHTDHVEAVVRLVRRGVRQ